MDGAHASSDGGQLKTRGWALEGPNSVFIKLVSSDDREFIVKREHAVMSNTIGSLINGHENFIENQTNRIHFKVIPGNILEIVCKYFMFKSHYINFPLKKVPQFQVNKIDSLQLLMASNFLDC